MKKFTKLSLVLSLLVTNNLVAKDLWEKYKPSAVGDIEKVYEKFDSKKPKRKNKQNVGTANWSLVNEDCTFNKDLLFEDSMDRLQENYEKVFQDLLDKGKNLFTNHMAMRESCNTVATGKCISGSMYEYINTEEVTAKLSECSVDNGKDIVKTNNEIFKGTDWVGCNVDPMDPTPAPPVVTYPYKANSTTVYVPCPPKVPKYTPFQIPITLNMNTQTVDYGSLNATMTCQTTVWETEYSNSFDRCMDKEVKSCTDFIQQKSNFGLSQSMENLELQDAKCKIEEKFVDTDMKEFIDKELENTKLPNNKVIKDGKVVTFDKKEKNLSFKPNESDELVIKREVLDTCISILSSDTFEGDSNKPDYDEVKKFCLEYKNNEMSEDFVMEQLKEIKSNFYSNPKIYFTKFEILNSYVKEWKDIIYKKFTKEIKYNPMKIVENSEIQKDLLKKLDLETDTFSKNYEIYSTKYDLIIEHINKMIKKYRKEYKNNNSRMIVK